MTTEKPRTIVSRVLGTYKRKGETMTPEKPMSKLAEKDRRITKLLQLCMKLDKQLAEKDRIIQAFDCDNCLAKKDAENEIGKLKAGLSVQKALNERLKRGIGERKGVIPFKDTPFGSELVKAVTEKINFLKERVGKVENDTYDIAWDDPKFVVLDKNRQLMIAEIIGMNEVLELLKGGKG